MARVLWTIATIACTLCTGCAARPKIVPATTAPANLQTSNRAAELQQALSAFVDRFMPALAEACDYIESNASAPEVRTSAKARKIGGAMAAMKNVVNPNPYAGLLDMVVMVTLLSEVADTPASKQLYGPYGQRLSAVMSMQKVEIWELASQFITEVQLQELRQSIKAWREAHPNLQYVAFVRMSDFPESKHLQPDQARSRRPNSVFGLLFLDPLSNLDPAVREFERSRQLAERAFFYMQRMPLVLSWQADHLYTQMLLAPELQSVVDSTRQFAGSTTRFSEASASFAATAARFEHGLPALQRNAVRDLEHAVERQRVGAVQQATTKIAAERDAAIRQIAAALRVEQQEMASGFDRVLQRAIEQMYRRVLAVVALLFVIFLVCIALLRRLPSRPSESSSSERRAVAR